MKLMMACASHSPLLLFPAHETEVVKAIWASLHAERRRIEEFNPDLVIIFGADHYGGHQMVSMPAFCVGVEATALADVGGTPGRLRVPKEVAVRAVDALRRDNIDVAVSYSMDVDHGFSQVLQLLTGGIDVYEVLPIFVSCIQPPFVPFHRARALGAAVGRYAVSLPYERILFVGTGGIAHNPISVFPPIDHVPQEWRPYHLFGKRQTGVSQQSWIDYQIAAHHQGALIIAEESMPLEAVGINSKWDREFMDIFCSGDLSTFDSWEPDDVVAAAGIGAMETLSWIAAGQAIQTATSARPRSLFLEGCREVGVGFGVAEAGPAPALAV